MKTIFAAAAIALAIGAVSAQASSGFNGSGTNGVYQNGATTDPTIGSADLIAIELPR